MAVQFSASAGAAQLSAIEATIGASPLLEFFTGSAPANCATVDSGTKLASLVLPADWMQSIGTISMVRLGEWTGSATATGNAGHFRLKTASGVTTHIQGTITRTGGAGDMIFDNVAVTSGHTITVGKFRFTGLTLSTQLSSCTFASTVAVRGPLHDEISDALIEMEGSMDQIKDEIGDTLSELEANL